MLRFLKEPFVHFVVLSIAIFGWFNIVQPAQWSSDPDARVIIMDQRQVDILATQFESTWNRRPSDEELDKLQEDWLNREVLVREALMLKLDGNDEIIRNRLVQKMNFLLASEARATRPDDTTLQNYLSANAESFTTPAQIAASLVYLGQNPSDASVKATLERLAAGEDHQQLGQASLLPSEFSLSSERSVDGNFGSGFFNLLEPLLLDQWSGPVRSTFGLHLVRLDNRQDPVPLALNEVRDRVLADWMNEQTQIVTQEFIENLRSTYLVQMSGTADADDIES